MEVSIDEPLNVDWDGNELLLSDILGTDEDVIYRGIENEVERKLLMNAVSKLSKREKTIIRLRFRTGDSGRTGDDPEGSGQSVGNLTILYFPTGEKDHAAAEKGDQPAYLTLHSGRIHDTI